MDTRERIVAYIREYIEAHGYAPSVREIVDGCGISSTSIVTYHLRALQQAGRVVRIPGIARGLRVVEPVASVA